MLKIYIGDYNKCKEIVGGATFYSNALDTITTKLFDNDSLVYFLYNKEELKDKEELFIDGAVNSNKTIICIADTIDKKSKFYKKAKQYITEFTIKETDIIKDIIKNPLNIFNVADNDLVTVLYKLYYQFKFMHNDNYLLVGRIINYVLVGMLNPQNAKRVYILETRI